MPIFFVFGFILITLVAYSIERILYLLWNWNFFTHQSLADLFLAFVMGWRFDLAAVCLLAAIPFLLAVVLAVLPATRNSRKALIFLAISFLVFQSPTMLLNLGDVEFINFLGRRYTFDALFFFREVPGKFWSLVFYYWPLALLSALIYAIYVVAIFKLIPRTNPGFQLRKLKLVAGALGGLLLIVIGARGGLQQKPLNFAHAQVFLNPSMNNLVLNSSFTFLQTVRRQGLRREKFYTSNEEMLHWLKQGMGEKSLLEGRRPSVKPNIVLIILESFSLEYMGKPHQGQGYTPFLDELADKGLFFTNAFANARRSIEGIGAIMGGVPALMDEPFISSQYLTNYFLGVGTLLQKQGYRTSFFHGAQNGSMYFDQFMRSAGMQNYYGKNEYPRPEESDGTWGIWDEPFLQWMSERISGEPGEAQEPFFSTVFTLSSHNPFRIPDQYKGRFPKGDLDIHESIGYTDYSLRRFFESASAKKWFKNTIFIITADHTYKSSRPGYENELGFYRIPLLIYSPGFELPKVDTSEIVQHVDILPTILDLVGSPSRERNFLGNSVFVPGDRFAVNYVDNRYSFIARDFFLQYHRGGDFQMFSMKDPSQQMLVNEMSGPLTERKEELTHKLKAVIQYFSQGLWDNKLYYPTSIE